MDLRTPVLPTDQFSPLGADCGLGRGGAREMETESELDVGRLNCQIDPSFTEERITELDDVSSS